MHRRGLTQGTFKRECCEIEEFSLCGRYKLMALRVWGGLRWEVWARLGDRPKFEAIKTNQPSRAAAIKAAEEFWAKRQAGRKKAPETGA